MSGSTQHPDVGHNAVLLPVVVLLLRCTTDTTNNHHRWQLPYNTEDSYHIHNSRVLVASIWIANFQSIKGTIEKSD
jgi:hypothetical protein